MQRRVGGESSEAESREPRGRLRRAEKGPEPQPPERDGSGRCLVARPHAPVSVVRREDAPARKSCGPCRLTRRHRQPAGLQLAASSPAAPSLLPTAAEGRTNGRRSVTGHSPQWT